MSSQRGMTLVELLIVLAMGAMVIVAAAAFAFPWLNRERMRSAIYDVQTHVQLARIEAVSHNRQCRFVLNTATRQISVLDTMGTPATADDEVLFETTLSDKVEFARPDAGAPVTLTAIGGNNYETKFNSDGSVANGVGEIVLFGGQRFGRLSVYGAGGTEVERWVNGAWHAGS